MQENSGEQLLIKKLDHNRGLHAKNQREISSNKVRTLHWPLGGRKCGKGGKWYKDRGKWIIESRIEFPDPMLMTLDTPHGPNSSKNQRDISKNKVRKPPPSTLCMEMWTFPFRKFNIKV